MNEVETKEGQDFGRERNTCLIVLCENDILINGAEYKHVANGEVRIFADGTIDESNGELVDIDREGLAFAIAAGRQIFNMEDV